MSMSVRCEGCGLEYAGARGAAGLFARPRNALRGPLPADARRGARFHRAARGAARPETRRTATADPHPRRVPRATAASRPTSSRHFMIPLVSAVWSCAPDTALRYPARYLFPFLDHHGHALRQRLARVADGDRRLAHATSSGSPSSSPPSAPPPRSARSRRHRDGRRVTATTATTACYDAVVVATHPDQALRLLADPTADERAVLGAFRYSRNQTVLHTDTSVLPRAPRRPRVLELPDAGLPRRRRRPCGSATT